MEKKYTLSFPGALESQKSDLAVELKRNILNNSGANLYPKTEQQDDENLDMGVILSVTLGAPSVIILAKAIKDWATRKNQGSIKMDGLEITGLESKDVAQIMTEVSRVVKT